MWFITQCILIRLYSFGKSCSVVLWAFNQWFNDSSEETVSNETIKIRQRMNPYTFRMTMTVKTMLLYLRALWDRTDPSQRRSIDLLPSWHTRPSGWLIGQTGCDPETTSLSQSLTSSVNHGLSSNTRSTVSSSDGKVIQTWHTRGLQTLFRWRLFLWLYAAPTGSEHVI